MLSRAYCRNVLRRALRALLARGNQADILKAWLDAYWEVADPRAQCYGGTPFTGDDSMNALRNKIALTAARGEITKDTRDILYGICDEIEGLASATNCERVPDERTGPLSVEPEDTGDGVRGIRENAIDEAPADDPNRENSLDVEQPSLARPSLRDA